MVEQLLFLMFLSVCGAVIAYAILPPDADVMAVAAGPAIGVSVYSCLLFALFVGQTKLGYSAEVTLAVSLAALLGVSVVAWWRRRKSFTSVLRPLTVQVIVAASIGVLAATFIFTTSSTDSHSFVELGELISLRLPCGSTWRETRISSRRSRSSCPRYPRRNG